MATVNKGKGNRPNKSDGKAPKGKAKKGPPEVPVKYPEYKAELRVFTVDDTKELLGWTEEPEGEEWGEFDLVDRHGKKVKLLNNPRNRSATPANYERVASEHLHKRWRVNGETMIVGKYGHVLDGQNRGIGHILAEQDRLLDTDGYWSTVHDGPITMSTFVAYGIPETDDVVDTIDTGKSRTLADVIYRSEYFQSLGATERKAASKVADHAVRQLWHRTWVSDSAFSPAKTHSEFIAFLENHPRLLECIAHVTALDKGNRVSSLYPLGYAAALMYMMASSNSDGPAYWEDREEKALDWAHWVDASNFWSELANPKDKSMEVVRKAIADLVNEATGRGGSKIQKTAVLCKAWGMYIDGDKLTAKGLELDVQIRSNGMPALVENPTVGGIDRGEPTLAERVLKLAKQEDEDGEEEEAPKPKAKRKAQAPVTAPEEGEEDDEDYEQGDEDEDEALAEGDDDQGEEDEEEEAPPPKRPIPKRKTGTR